MKRTIQSAVLLAALVGILGSSTGCRRTGWVLPPFIGGTVFGFLLAGGQNVSVTVERNCFENGVPVDCSQIPGAQSAGTN